MKRNYPGKDIDVCLITAGEVDLGIRSLSSFLKEKGYRVILGFFDTWGIYKENEIASIIRWVRETNPRIIGISSLEFTRDKVIHLMSVFKKEGRVVVGGGVDPTFNPECYLDYADFIIRGEGEHSFVELVEAVTGSRQWKDIPNLCYRDGAGRTVVNPQRPLIQDLDGLPFEDYLDLEHHYELAGGEVKVKQKFVVDCPWTPRYSRGGNLFTIRGCSLSCNYCVNFRMKELNPHETHIRKRSVPSVVRRAEELKKADPSLGIFYFQDDDFFLRTEDEVREFAAAWKERIGLPFHMQASPTMLNENKLKELVEAGLFVVSMGIQTGSERINFELYQRRISNERIIEVAHIVNRHIGKGPFGFLPPWYNLIINNPYETRQDILATVDLLKRLPKPYSISTPSLEIFQGTKLYEKAVADGVISGRDDSARYNYCDTLRHFDNLIQRGGDYYLNSLLYWMNGSHTERNYGIIPAKMLQLLTHDRTMRYFNGNPRAVSFLNGILPTQKRLENALQSMVRNVAGRMKSIISR